MTAHARQFLKNTLSHSRICRQGVLSFALLSASASCLVAQTTARVILKKDPSTPAHLSYQFRTGKNSDFNPVELPADKIILLDVDPNFLAPDTQLFLIDKDSQRVAQFPLPDLSKQREHNGKKGEFEPNLLRNGLFQSGTTHWQKLPAIADVTLVTRKAETGQVKGQALELKLGAKTDENTAVAAETFALTDNREYQLTFAARADKSRTVRLAVRLNGSDETAGLNKDQAISTEWQTYTLPFSSLRTSPVLTAQKVNFSYEGDAKQVFVAGNFNNWSTSSHPMERDPVTKKWRTILSLRPGAYEYKFFVDGEWTADTNAPMKAEGNHNSTVQVGSVYPVQLVLLPGKGAGSVQIGDVRLQIRRAPKFALESVTATANSFRLAQSVSIPIQLDGRPVQGVTVALKTEGIKGGEVPTMRPDDTGTAVFKNVPLNTAATIVVKAGSQTETFKDSIKNEGKTTLKAISLPSSWSKSVTFIGNAPVAGTVQKEEGGTRLLLILGVVAGALLAALGSLMFSINNKRKQEMPLAALPSAPAVSGRIAAQAVVPMAVPARQTASVLSGSSTLPNKVSHPFMPADTKSGTPQLTGLEGTYGGYTFALASENNQIGRDITSTVALPQDTNVSRRHATLHVSDGEYILTDEASSNGTYVNGQKLPSNTPHPLISGDEIEFGSSRFRFEA